MLEKILNTRLMWFLEQNKILTPESLEGCPKTVRNQGRIMVRLVPLDPET